MFPFLTVIGLGLAVGIFTASKMNLWGDVEPELFARPAPKPLHEVAMGATGSGKSVYIERRTMEAAVPGDRFIMLGDPHGNLADKCLSSLLAEGLEDRIIYDKLSFGEVVPGYEFFRRSTATDELTRMNEDRLNLDTFLDILIRDQDTGELGPLKGKWARAACRCWVSQQTPLPLSWLPYALQVKSDRFRTMIDNCIDENTAFELKRMEQYSSPHLVDRELDPARRLLEIIDTPSFLARSSVEPFDLRQAMIDKKILILSGGGAVSPEAIRLMLATLATNVTRTAERHFDETGESLFSLIIQDECNAFSLVRNPEILLMAQCRKWGVEWLLSFQHFDMDEEITNGLLQNCRRQTYFRQGSAKSARIAADQIATRMLDPHKILEIEKRTRAMPIGYESKPTESVSISKDANGERKTTTKGASTRTVYDYVEEEQKRYQNLNDQVAMTAKKLMTLPVGHMLQCDDEIVTTEAQYVLPWESSWTPGTTSQAISRIRSRPLYQKPNLLSSQKQQAKGGAAARRRSEIV